ncbi:probable E3 ubiquitin-protein ligase ARI7 [Setaria viridis]|uniref:probable E3 ubiquitin-protein ligase ARI7 n=1 Tax=Setaria viridis TaxID=4556 RepID=UPI003B3ABA37
MSSDGTMDCNDGGSSGEEYYFDDDCDGDEIDGYVDNCDKKMKDHIVLTEDEVRRGQEKMMAKVAELLSFPLGFAATVLRHFKWNEGRVEERWFSDDRRIRDAVGLPADGVPVPMALSAAEASCAICFAEYPAGQMRSAGCAHFYCGECWRGDRYARFALRSFVEEGSGRIKWCPAPGCTLAVEYVGGADGDGNADAAADVFCACRHGFCWRCGEEAHRPVSCDTVRAWLEKNSSYSATANWVLLNTKLCPQCRRPIEKNQGCMHMTCLPPCGYEFCWVCLDPWKNHRRCRGFGQGGAPDGDGDGGGSSREEQEQRRRHAQMSLDRYLYHYERWVANYTSLEKVRQDMDELESSEIRRIAAMVELNETNFAFLNEAYEQIAHGRRVLKWAYAYGYYLDPVRDAAKRGLFEHLLDQANSRLDQLHDAAELERREIFCSSAERTIVLDLLSYYQAKVKDHTKATQQFMGNLVKAFETTDLPEFKSLN